MKFPVTILVVCISCVQIISAEVVKVKLYKTDPTTWNKPFYYDLAWEETTKKERAIGKTVATKEGKRFVPTLSPKTPEKTAYRDRPIIVYKPIKKDITISYDPDRENTLWICPTPEHAEHICKKLILSTSDASKKNEPQHQVGNVIAIDKDYQPTSMSKSQVDKIIKANQNKFFKIPVYKEDPTTWEEKWTITLVDDKNQPYPDAKIDIRQNSSFLGSSLKKLWIQKDIQPGSTYVQVHKPNELHIIETPLENRQDVPWAKRILVIDAQGKARFENESFFRDAPVPPKPSKEPKEKAREPF